MNFGSSLKFVIIVIELCSQYAILIVFHDEVCGLYGGKIGLFSVGLTGNSSADSENSPSSLVLRTNLEAAE